MKDLIKLTPMDGEISEVRGLEDLVILLKKRNQAGRLSLLQRLNLEDIETPYDLYCILEVLTTTEVNQLTQFRNADFLNRLIGLTDNWEQQSYLKRHAHQLITADNIGYFIPLLEKYKLWEIEQLCNALSEESLKKMLIVKLGDTVSKMLQDELTTTHVKQSEAPISFAKWSNDYYHEGAWNDISEDTHGDRCNLILSIIASSLGIYSLIENPSIQHSTYLDTLFSLLDEIINNPSELNYLLGRLSERNQHLFKELMFNRGFTPQIEASMKASKELKPKEKQFPYISMIIIGACIAVLGITAIALAFTVLNIAALGIAGMVMLTAGATLALANIGLFAVSQKKPQEKVLHAVEESNNFAIL